ncbi:DUF1003 domain-containing protein [Massilia arenosa]|uniref:DUF1003 domain-containing protein n=1 Tax=Zemynaea arenosa TaxID=2561931 RepID=A0A4Y9RR61_9BURK|nr:DUF1003 domain-containing protein [Massilia arenosa]TFW10771.1 DUF1003 domain-containing protein [Massilia arenosa]
MTLRDRYRAERKANRERSNESVELHLKERRSIARTQREQEDDSESTLGERAADAIARFGGSWVFISLFFGILIGWVVINSVLLARAGDKPFDPYPYILLNLMLSMLASFQAPVILMSQNRQATKDRQNAQHDYEVNLKAELEIMELHAKLDALKLQEWEELLKLQRIQLRLLSKLTGEHVPECEPANGKAHAAS